MFKFIICFVAGIGAGLGTGFAGMSAAAVISPMLITFLGLPAYEAVGIALASDVLASAVSAYTYGRNKNLDIRNGVVMMVSVLLVTLFGSWVASKVPNTTMGNFSVFMTLLLGIKFIVKRQEADHSVGDLRFAGRIYLRFYRCRRRHDDAADLNRRVGI